MEKKWEYIARYLADVSKLIVGIGVVTKLFAPSGFNLKLVIIGLLIGLLFVILGFVAQPRR